VSFVLWGIAQCHLSSAGDDSVLIVSSGTVDMWHTLTHSVMFAGDDTVPAVSNVDAVINELSNHNTRSVSLSVCLSVCLFVCL